MQSPLCWNKHRTRCINQFTVKGRQLVTNVGYQLTVTSWLIRQMFVLPHRRSIETCSQNTCNPARVGKLIVHTLEHWTCKGPTRWLSKFNWNIKLHAWFERWFERHV